jgi:two-component sensor histidine kinase/tetratricopeptide (TPR) repeat protein
MFENLKIALRKQKKLIIIFFLAIFIPSLSLSIFGIRAIRNERYRLAKQIENENRRAADFLKRQINSRFIELESALQKLARYPSFSKKNHQAIKDLLSNQLTNNHLIDQIFIFYKNEEPRFPLFAHASAKDLPFSPLLLKGSHGEKLKKAEEYEFKQKEYRGAISLYQELFNLLKEKNFKAQMLNNTARCLTKLKSYRQAINNYSKIIKDYPESISSSRLPLTLIAGLQTIDCYQKMGDFRNSLKSSLGLYKDILQMQWGLNEDQFRTYASMAEESITRSLPENPRDFPLEEYEKEFEQLKSLHQEKIEQWKIVNDIKRDIIPELRRRLTQAKEVTQFALRYSKAIEDRNFLISAVMIPDESGIDASGMLGFKIKNEYLRDEVLGSILENIQFAENTEVVISSLSGQVFLGNKDPSTPLPTITEFFEDSFPPWRIELFSSQTGALGPMDLRNSYYFWTILTLIIILIFGAFLIVRTISHEMEILKIKSDFVSSVSHELKTPLTSIKALAERLQEGKVKDQSKAGQYFSIISQDTEKLTRLVKNILDFSKIEEGKKEYEFTETDVAQFVTQQIENFRKVEIQKGAKIHAQIPKDIPHLFVDRDALSQAIINLIDNATKFSPDKKEIFVNLKSDTEKVIVEVKDQGAGIPQDEINKIFDKFYQGKSTLRLSVTGTGLGLTLVRHIVEAHGGRISVESKIGQGSTFSLIFPLRGKEK